MLHTSLLWSLVTGLLYCSKVLITFHSKEKRKGAASDCCFLYIFIRTLVPNPKSITGSRIPIFCSQLKSIPIILNIKLKNIFKESFHQQESSLEIPCCDLCRTVLVRTFVTQSPHYLPFIIASKFKVQEDRRMALVFSKGALWIPALVLKKVHSRRYYLLSPQPQCFNNRHISKSE